MAEIIDGKVLANKIADQAALEVAQLVATTGRAPGLAVVLVGNDPASDVYVRRKIKECRKVGIVSIEHRLPAESTQDRLSRLIDTLNDDPCVDGILVQLPLPKGIDATPVRDRIMPDKDVDGFHPVNVGRLSSGTSGLIPRTPLGIMTLLDTVIDDYCGLNIVVIGKSNTVGKLVSMLLLEREPTVTVTHIETIDLADIARKADVVVAAAGARHLVRGYWVKPGAIVIDVGITRVIGPDAKPRIVGDCATDELDHACAVTLVPGGVGPMTIACLLANTASSKDAPE